MKEIKAMDTGLKLCVGKGFESIREELVSLSVANLTKKHNYGPWQVQYHMVRIFQWIEELQISVLNGR